MDRRRILTAIGCVGISSLAGCLNDPGMNGGLLEVMRATEPEDATIIDASDDRVRTVEPILEGLQRAATARESVAEVEVTEREYETVAQTLSELPWYDRSAHGSRHQSGVYVRYENDSYVAVLTPFCADSRIREAESEQGEYGWGGCYDRAEWGYP